jgi:hypothetical protein
LHQEELRPLQEAWGCPYNTQYKNCCKYEKDRTKKADFHAAKKDGKKPYPVKQSFAQLSKKLAKLEKAMKKQSTKSKKRWRDDSSSYSELVIGLCSIRKVEIK